MLTMTSTLPQSSYYLLYRNDDDVFERSLIKSDHRVEEVASKSFENGSNPEKQESGFWQEFSWSESGRSEIQKTLAQSIVKNDIVNNMPSGRGRFIIDKLEQEAGANWDKFYTAHQTKFFKDRHYLEKAFPEDFGDVYGMHRDENSGIEKAKENDCVEDFTIVEIGCGVGNTVLPLLELDQTMYTLSANGSDLVKRRLAVWGLDFSTVAVELLQKDSRYIEARKNDRAKSAVWDITISHPREISRELELGANISLLLFCLSAVSPSKMAQAASNVAATLKPGGVLILRDYGRFDEAQVKLGSSRAKRISDNFYVKHDSTRVYYFDLEDLEMLFGKDGAGLDVIEVKYIQRVYKNRSTNSERRRVWVQARFRKPM
mmetsp:Transcript_10705/g.15613  ORF Transcript_10705/g.15613 Transcript_10705/m.15613 type:complete len:374 (+) Transcript_10705:27-1148(+)